MKLAWHIIRKDLVRLKWILLLWAIVLIGGLALAALQASLDVEGYTPFYIAARVTLSGFVPLIVFGMVMGLIHDDPVADIDAFWITRPISGGDLLIAKTAAWALLGLVPVLVLLPFWLSYDYNWSLVGHAIRQTYSLHLVLAALALPFAVISANGSRFVMNLLLAAGVVTVLALVSSLGDSAGGRSSDPELTQSKAWLLAALWVAATATVVPLQFLRRRTWRSVAVLSAAVVLGYSVTTWWSWEFTNIGAAKLAAANSALVPGQKFASIEDIPFNRENKPAMIAMEVPLIAGKSTSRNGMMLKIQFAYFTNQLQVAFSEATPYPFTEVRDLLPGTPPKPGPLAYYFVLNRSDGRGFAVEPARVGNELEAGTLHYSHSGFVIRPTNWWHGNAPSDLAALAAWLKSASLVKVAIIGRTNE